MAKERKRERTRYRGVYRNGSVYQTRIEVPDPDRPGMTKRRWLTGPTAKAVRQLREEEEGKVRRNEYVPASKMTLEEFGAAWAPSLASIRATTKTSYARHVRLYIAPALGHLRLQAVTPAAINAFYADLLAKKGPAMVQHVHRTLHRMLRDGVRQGVLARNPADGVELPRVRQPEMRTWTAEQLGRFLQHVRDERLHAVWLILCTTGVRRGEALGLRWKDLDLDAGRMAIRRSLIPTSDGLVFEEPKTERGRRSVALDRGTVAALRNHRHRQLEEWLALGWGRPSADDLVFANRDGSPISPGGISQQFGVRVKQAGLPPIRLHDLRHTHATLMLQAGTHPRVVQERLGHSSIVMTLDLYSHSVPAMEEAAAERVAALVFGEVSDTVR